MTKSHKKFIIFDGNALVHRAWHALPMTLTTKDGTIVNAVYGFTSVFLKALKDLKPDYIAVTFDLAGPTFRHEKFKEYKAGREKQVDEFYTQFPIIKDLLRAFNIKIFEKQGFEADDLIGTLCDKKQVNRDDVLSVIVTGDMDTMQLVDANTHVYTLKKGLTDTVIYDVKAVKEKYGGLTPEQMIDYKALRGDPSDNIPGVKGIGEKTATALLTEFGTLEKLYSAVEKNKAENVKERIRNLLIEHKKDALMSKDLATIEREVKIDFNLEDCKYVNYDKDKVYKLLSELEFKSLLSRLPEQTGRPGSAEPFESLSVTAMAGTQGGFDFGKTGITKVNGNQAKFDYKLIDDDKKFAEFLTELKKQKIFCFDTETTGLNIFEAKLIGLSFSWKKGQAYYVVFNEKYLSELKPIFEDAKIKKVAHNMKFDASMLKMAGVDLANYYFDTMIASYLLDSSTRQHGLDRLAFIEFQHKKIATTELIGEGKNQITMDKVDVKKVAEYSCEDADFTWRLYELFEPRLEKNKLKKLFDEIEMPLIPVLIEMEVNGVKIDVEQLKKLSKKITKKIEDLKLKIYKLAGQEFNISSPLQLKEILFDKLKISTKGIKHTKTGLSTAAAELEKMRGEHEIIDLISDYRELSKLKSTYVDALPKLVNKETGRLHTSFNQTITATGRLSSSEPNLQNIPIRTELGREIRKAFIAEDGNLIVAADYSQVELRVIACLAKDEHMMEVFNQGKDIHAATAAKIFDVKLEDVTKDMRRKAKEVNFGVLYGMGASGLAQRTGITRAEAKEFIEKYFTSYKKVKEYTEKMVVDAQKNEFVETMFGRRRYLPEINSNVQMLRAQAERMAVNMPIQGTAADLMKIAMIEVYKELKTISPKSKMLLQVHDELVIEVPEKDVEKVAKVVDEKMEKIHKLCVPLNVDTEVGKNWDEMGNHISWNTDHGSKDMKT
jgi:DNA polymerase I